MHELDPRRAAAEALVEGDLEAEERALRGDDAAHRRRAGLAADRQQLQPAGFGHAWAEIHDAGQWRLVDATPAAEPQDLRAYYLPFFALEDEGPGYTVALTAATQAVWVREIELLGTR